jgi:hypothetical protein
VDQTGSEESKQPAGESAEAPSRAPTDEQHATGERSGQEDGPQSARRAFDLLERFSGELEEILQSLERTKGTTTPAEESPPAPERSFRPSSIHFDSSPISTRIDPYALPPVESPRTTSRTTPRLLLEALFLILVAVISARTGLRPLLIAAAEAAAFFIVTSIELAVAREKRHLQQFPAASPSFAAPLVQEVEKPPRAASVTLDQVEPLVWQADRPEFTVEPDWPLVAGELPSEAEDTQEAQEGVTEISAATDPEARVAAISEVVPVEPEPEVEPESLPEPSLEEVKIEVALEPEVESEAVAEPDVQSEAVAEPGVQSEAEVELEAPSESFFESSSADVEPEQRRRFHLFRREEKLPEADPEAAAEPEVESEPGEEPETELEIGAGEAAEATFESAPEVFAAEVEPKQPRRFHLFRHEASELEVEPEPEAVSENEAETEVEVEPAAEVKPAAELESVPELVTDESELGEWRRLLSFREEENGPEVESAPEAETDAEDEAGAEPESELESAPEVFIAKVEPKQPRRFHLLQREERANESEPEGELESTAEIPALEAEPEHFGLSHFIEREEKAADNAAADEPEVEAESSFGGLSEESEPEPARRFHLFRHEERVHEEETEQEVVAEPEIESELEAEAELQAEVEPEPELPSIPEVFPVEVEPEQPARFRLFRHEEKASEPEAQPYAEEPGDQTALPAGAPWQDALEEPGSVIVSESAEIAVEIDLPPEIEVDEIERTLEDLGRRTPGLRRRRWPLGGGVEMDTASPAPDDETLGEASEVRLTAERERRRREREYLRSLRVPR